MKIKFKLLITLIPAFYLLFISGCSMLSFTPSSMTNNNTTDNTAKITFGTGIRLVEVVGNREYTEGGRWSFITLPAGRPADLRVYVYWDGDIEGSRRRGIFKCPPLEAGAEYRIRFDFRTRGVFIKVPTNNLSIVLEKRRGSLLGSPYEIVYSQSIPPL